MALQSTNSIKQFLINVYSLQNLLVVEIQEKWRIFFNVNVCAIKINYLTFWMRMDITNILFLPTLVCGEWPIYFDFCYSCWPLMISIFQSICWPITHFKTIGAVLLHFGWYQKRISIQLQLTIDLNAFVSIKNTITSLEISCDVSRLNVFWKNSINRSP